MENNHDNQLLLEKNNQIHLNQYDYLIKRYLLNIERENDISMRQFREISETLHPMGGLQERVWNPLQIMNDFGIDVFSPSTYPPLSYSFGRMIIPSKFRYDLNERFIITRGLDKCLFGYTLEEWQQIEEKMKTLPMTKKDARKFMRMFFSGAVEVELDKQGRINIPQNLRKYANLSKECTVIGVSNRIGIWDRETWNDFYDESEESFEDIAEDLIDFDF